MRGKGCVFAVRVKRQRITPAYAGKSRVRNIVSVHIYGSPPPMRGKGFDVPVIQRQDGITPAYAGKSGIVSLYAEFFQDHPRLCGEKVLSWIGIGFGAGSPPPMRGKAYFRCFFGTSVRITPAYAGKSTCVHQQKAPAKDHPRLCGEKPERCICPHSLVGSPPPMRGKVLYTICNYKWCRITPAYAGKRYFW